MEQEQLKNAIDDAYNNGFKFGVASTLLGILFILFFTGFIAYMESE
jgi:hypothetical protein